MNLDFFVKIVKNAFIHIIFKMLVIRIHQTLALNCAFINNMSTSDKSTLTQISVDCKITMYLTRIAVIKVKMMDQWTERDILNVPPTLVFLLLFIK